MRKFLTLTNATFQKHNVSTLKELWQKAAAEGYEGMSSTCTLTLEKDADTKKFHAVFSSEVEDRHGEIVYQSFDLKAFKKNPVFLDSHNYGSIEHIIGRIEPISVKDEKLQGDIEFALDNPRGMLAQNLADKGFLNTTSIGFIPKEFDDKGNILKSELLEISAVSVPANPEALFEKDHDDFITTPTGTGPSPVSAPTETSPQPKTDARRAAKDAIEHLLDHRARHLKIIARELTKISEPAVQKRRVYRSIREVLKADISVQ
jgi:HK97 family phage prohead protease